MTHTIAQYNPVLRDVKMVSFFIITH